MKRSYPSLAANLGAIVTAIEGVHASLCSRDFHAHLLKFCHEPSWGASNRDETRQPSRTESGRTNLKSARVLFCRVDISLARQSVRMLGVEHILSVHNHLLSGRTRIRNSKTTLQWMKRCWKLALCASLSSSTSTSSTTYSAAPSAWMTATAYGEFYAALLSEMTICPDDELLDTILHKMRQRNMAAFAHLNFDRFCCSLFFFAEMVRVALVLSLACFVVRGTDHVHDLLTQSHGFVVSGTHADAASRSRCSCVCVPLGRLHLWRLSD